MKFKCDKKELVNAMKIAVRAIPSKTSMPVLECVLIETNGDSINLTANDMEFGIITSVPAEIIEEGAVAVSGKLFNDIITKLPSHDVQVAVDGNFIVTIKSGKSKFNIPGRNNEEFVKLPDTDTGNVINVASDDFGYMVSRTVFCAAGDGNNPMMNGVYIEVKNNVMKMMATDGHRIAVRSLYFDSDKGDVKAIIPVKPLNEITRVINDDDIDIEFTRNHVIFRFGDTTAVTRVIEGNYFDFGKVLSNEYNIEINMDAKELRDSVARATVLCREGEKKPLVVNAKDDVMEMTVTTNLGNTFEEIAIEKHGDDIRIGLNPRFILDAVNAIEDDEITMRLISPKAPIVFTKGDADYTYVVLPVNIQ